MSGERWSRDENIVALDLYLNREAVRASDSQVEEVAGLTGRSPLSIQAKIANYRSVNPRDTAKGLTQISKAGERVWEEFYGREEELQREAEMARRRLFSEESEAQPENSSKEPSGEVDTGEASAEAKARIGQQDFRAGVTDRYGGRCVMCGVDRPGLLVAAHILDWSENEELRGDPANGLLLCTLHHRAFDLGLFTLTEDYEILVNPEFDPTSEFLQRTIVEREGEILEFPEEPPSPEYLAEWNAGLTFN